MRQLAAITAVELKQACLEIVTEAGDIESPWVPREAADKLGASMYDAHSLGVQSMNHHREVIAAERRWNSRVRGQLDKLAAEGTIVKIGAHETLPTGYSSGNRARYYTPEAYEAAVQKHNDGLKEKTKRTERWQKIRVRLVDGAGVMLSSEHRLSPDEWEQLLDRAGW